MPSVVVTGAASGIGRACCARFDADGYEVVGFDVGPGEDAPWERVVGDVSSYSDCGRLQEVIRSRGGRLDALVTCAGIATYGNALVDDRALEEWETCYRINVLGTLAVVSAMLPALRAAETAAIVTVSSIAARRVSTATSAAYGASKAAVAHLSRWLAVYLGGDGVRVNCVSPGMIDTPMTKDWDEDLVASLVKGIPLGRTGAAQDVASVVRFLCSDDARYVTGATVDVNGGQFMML